MKTPAIGLSALAAALVLGSGCVSTEVVDLNNDRGPAVMGLDYRDFENAAQDAVSKMLASGAAAKPQGGRYVLAVGRILNKTTQSFDTDQLVRKITIELRNSGKVVVTKALDQNSMIRGVRDLKDDDLFNKDTVAESGTVIAPELELKGKIIERNLQISSRKKQTEYYLQLELNDIKSGLAYWEGETQIVKRGSAKSVNW